jgi:putative nucleotidyltransferase-like protein/transglutaminase superfamily protein
MWRRWRDLSRRERRETLLAIALLPLARASLKTFGANRTLAWVAPAGAGPKLDTAGAVEGARRAAYAVARASNRGPHAGNCLSRSVALMWLLRRRGIDGQVRFGARTIGGKFEAHAWVEVNGVVINDHDRVTRSFATLQSPGPDVQRSGPAPLTLVQRTLLACLRPSTDDVLSAVSRLTETHWDHLIAYATAQQVRPLLLRRLTAADVRRHVPARTLERLEGDCRVMTVRNMRALADFGVVAGALARHDIAVIALKGVHLAATVYADAGLREMLDIDVLVKPADARRAFEVVRELGYRPVEEGAHPSGAPPNHLPRLLMPGRRGIEIHWDVALAAHMRRADSEGFWNRAVGAVIGGTPTLVLCPEDVILHTCVHASYHHWFDFGLRPYCDVAAVIRAAPDLDWDGVVDRAQHNGWSRGVYLTLRLAKVLLAAAVPESVLESIKPPEFDEALVEFARLEVMSPVSVSPRMAGLAAAAGPGARVRHLLRRAFPGLRAIEREYGLPAGSRRALLYQPVLLRDLLRRHSRDLYRLLFLREKHSLAAARRRHALLTWLDGSFGVE